jgi:hypothetical protein
MTTSSGPVMQLVASGLQLWVRQQCDAIESLEIQLEGSALGLLRGKLAGVSLMARRVSYQQLELELVQLTSSPIEVNIGKLLKGQPLQLQHPFTIQGQVGFTAEGLNQSITKPQWRGLADHLGEMLLGISPLMELRISQDKLIFAAKAAGEVGLVELETHLDANDGAVVINASSGGLQVDLPMDPGITIERANLEGGMVQLYGTAKVSVGAAS